MLFLRLSLDMREELATRVIPTNLTALLLDASQILPLRLGAQ